MSSTAYIVYTFHLSLHHANFHANFGQFKAKQVLWNLSSTFAQFFFSVEYFFSVECFFLDRRA